MLIYLGSSQTELHVYILGRFRKVNVQNWNILWGLLSFRYCFGYA